MTRPPVADFQAIAGEMVSANVKSTNKILAGSEFVESWAGSRTIRQPTPAARASAAIWLENMRSWTNARTLISSGIRGVYTRTRTFSPLLRYSGGGQGWGPNFQSALDKPPPYPSPGVPGEGTRLGTDQVFGFPGGFFMGIIVGFTVIFGGGFGAGGGGASACVSSGFAASFTTG